MGERPEGGACSADETCTETWCISESSLQVPKPPKVSVSASPGPLAESREQVALNVMLPQNEAPQYTYEAVFQVPPNTSSNGDPVKYTVQLIALDTNGQESSQQAYFQVAPPPAPPAPPR